jgi:hypothetical protein
VEEDVKVFTRKSDLEIVQKAVKEAIQEYKEKAGPEVTIDVKEGLPEERQVRPPPPMFYRR